MGLFDFMGGLFSGDQGAGFKAQSAPIMQTVTPEQLQTAQKQQADFVKALQAQYPGALEAQKNLLAAYGQQAQGLGPNVAQSMLSQATGANVANQAALMAGQRGAGANAGLMARQAAQQGAQTQQQAAGQAATLQANQQLAAQQAMGNLAAQQITQTGGYNLQQQQALQNAAAQLNQANIANVQQQNQYNAQIAAGNQQFQSGLTGGLLSSAGQGLAALALASGGEVKKYGDGGQVDDGEKDSDKWYSEFNKRLSQSSTAPQYQSGFEAGKSIGQGAGKMLGKLFGNAPGPQLPTAPQTGQLGVNTAIPQMANPLPTSQNIGAMQLPTMPAAPVQNPYNLGVNYAHGGKVDAMLSPGERYLSPDDVEKVKSGKMKPMDGKLVPGKAKIKGDSLKNDTVPAKLDDGGIVIPRRVTQSENPDEKARRFVAAVVARQKMKRK